MHAKLYKSNLATESLIVIAKLHVPTNMLIILLGKEFSIMVYDIQGCDLRVHLSSVKVTTQKAKTR